MPHWLTNSWTALSDWLTALMKNPNLLAYVIITLILGVVLVRTLRWAGRKAGSSLLGANGTFMRHPRWAMIGFAAYGVAAGAFVASRHLLPIDPFGVMTEPMLDYATIAAGLVFGLLIGAIVARLVRRTHGASGTGRRKDDSVADVYIERKETPFYGPRNIRQDVFELYQVDGKMPPEMVESYRAEVDRRIAEHNDGKRGQLPKAETDQAIFDRVATKYRQRGMTNDDLLDNIDFAQEVMRERAARDRRRKLDDQTILRNQ